MYLGLGAVALWLYVRIPRLRPTSLTRAVAHVVLSFAVVLLLPLVLAILFTVANGKNAAFVFVVAVLMPAVCYLLLSWFWLLGRIFGDLSGGTPRGGHPVAAPIR